MEVFFMIVNDSYTDYWRGQYRQKEKILEEAFPRSTYEDFYRDLFPIGSLQNSPITQFDGDNPVKNYGTSGNGNAVIYYHPDKNDYHRDKKKLQLRFNPMADFGVPDEEGIPPEFRSKYYKACDDLDKSYRAGKYKLRGVPFQRFKLKDGEIDLENPYVYRQVLHDAHLELKDMQGKHRAIISPMTFYGARRNAEKVSKLYSITIDLDLVKTEGLKNLTRLMFDSKILPIPTYIVNSGKGVHLYFMLEEPIDLHSSKDACIQIAKFKNMITQDYFWLKNICSKEKVDSQPLTQSYSVIGALSRLGKDYPVTAFKTGEKVSLEYLNSFIYDEKNRLVLPFKKNMTLEEAKAKYPNWNPSADNQKVKEKENKDNRDDYRYFTNHYVFNFPHRGPYNSWLKKLRAPKMVQYGSRYHCIKVLYVTALKCGIPKSEARRDAISLIEHFCEINPDEPFTMQDINAAETCYKESYRALSVKGIAELTHIPLTPAKRNRRYNIPGEKQQISHLRFLNEDMERGRIKNTHFGSEDGNKINKDGRPTAEQTVRDYLQAHPDAKKAEVIRETGLSKPTVYKWYDKIKEGDKSNETSN